MSLVGAPNNEEQFSNTVASTLYLNWQPHSATLVHQGKGLGTKKHNHKQLEGERETTWECAIKMRVKETK